MCVLLQDIRFLNSTVAPAATSRVLVGWLVGQLVGQLDLPNVC